MVCSQNCKKSNNRKGSLTTRALLLLIAGFITITVVAFHSSSSVALTQTASDFVFHKNRLTWRTLQQSSSSFSIPAYLEQSWLKKALKDIGLDFDTEKLAFQKRQNKGPAKSKNAKNTTGLVIFTAAKPFDPKLSKPSSKLYTTRKNSKDYITLTPGLGVNGDYNHYRTIALKSTSNREVSIVTSDIYQSIQMAGYGLIQNGDLGENILINNVHYTFFQIGHVYKFYSSSDTNEETTLVEITERIDPCGNLCTLPTISDVQLQPKERLDKCKSFLLHLDQDDGYRGWYGKIINGGKVTVGDKVSIV